MKPAKFISRVSEADVRLLHIFVAIAESGGLAAAALRLNLSLSVVGRHLKDLELRLGVRLCERGRGGFRLSTDGQVVYEAARTLLAQMELFRSKVAELHTAVRGELNIAVFEHFVSNPDCRLAQAIAKFNEEAPSVSINISVAVSTELEKGLTEGRYHVGIEPFHRASDSYLWTPLFNEQMYLYCSNRHPLAAQVPAVDVEAIRQAAVVSLGFHSMNVEAIWRLALNPVAKAFGQEGTLAMIASGRFIGFLPDHYAAAAESRGELLRLQPDVFNYVCNWGAVTMRTPKPGRIAARFVEILREVHVTAS